MFKIVEHSEIKGDDYDVIPYVVEPARKQQCCGNGNFMLFISE